MITRRPDAEPIALGTLFRDRAFLSILIFAVVVRIGIAIWPVIHHADEVWQYLEPAFHVGVGPWVMTWEAREGARSWLLPMLFAGPTALGYAIAPGTALAIVLPRLVCGIVSFGTIVGAAALGARLSRMHAVVAAVIATTWFEIAYFSSRTLSEPIATACFVAAAASLLVDRAPRWTVIGGALLAACCLVRFQYAPAAGILALWVGRLDRARWQGMILGGIGAMIVAGAADLAGGAWPFLWIVRNFTLNLIDNRSAAFGVDPPWRYLVDIWDLWGIAVVPILILSVIGARRYPVLLVAAVVNLAVHALVPHKEYRFILLTTTLIVLLAGIGSVDLLGWFQKKPATGWIAAGWVLVSVACGATGDSVRTWSQNPELLAAWTVAGSQPRVCGVAVYRPEEPIVGSHALFGRTAPIYQYGDDARDAARASRAFNLVMTSAGRAADLPAYRLLDCPFSKRRYCVYARPGPCATTAADAPFGINRVFERQGI